MGIFSGTFNVFKLTSGSTIIALAPFSKALGTGISGFDLRDVYIIKDELGKPELIVKDRAQELLEKKCGTNSRLHVTLSHEKEYAVAFVQIEN